MAKRMYRKDSVFLRNHPLMQRMRRAAWLRGLSHLTNTGILPVVVHEWCAVQEAAAGVGPPRTDPADEPATDPV